MLRSNGPRGLAGCGILGAAVLLSGANGAVIQAADPGQAALSAGAPLALDERIRTSQVGFRPQQPKRVTIAWGWPGEPPPSLQLEIVRAGSGDVVRSAALADRGRDPDSGERVLEGEFSALSAPGTYQVRLPGRGLSAPFVVAEDALRTPLRLAARWFYLQRSGAAKDDPVTGLRHGADYAAPSPPRRPTPGAAAVDVSGGWWDAGDFGRYVPPAATTLMSLLYAYRWNPRAFADGSLGIPESGNRVPDLLDELRWELTWLLKMQRADGAVHHKAATRRYAPGMADADPQPALLYEISTQATAQLTGALAAASIPFRSVDAQLAAAMRAAAERAYRFLAAHPRTLPPGGFKNPDDPNGGDYSLKGKDESELRMWAAASLFAATGEKEYDEAFRRLFAARDRGVDVYGLGWPSGAVFAMQAYLDSATGAPELKAEMRSVMLQQAQRILRVVEESPYRVALRGVDPTFGYSWGSIGVLLNHATYLLLADRLQPDPRLRDAASAQLEWVLGRNPLAKCFLTGVGHNPIRAPHHRPSFHLGAPIPGAVGEGPNAMTLGGDPALKKLFAAQLPPALRYIDDAESYATNEPTIYYNAAFVAVAAALSEGAQP